MTDGIAALEFLAKPPAQKLPDIIVMDLGLPRMNGHEVLRALRRDSAVSYIPVIIFSSSESPHDKTEAFELGAKEFVSKPMDFTGYEETVKRLINECCTRTK